MTVDVLTSLLLARSAKARGEQALKQGQTQLEVGDVYEAHFQYVFRCLRHLGVRDGSLDDATQDVFMVVHDKLAGFEGQAALKTWLYAIVIRIARRYRERQARASHHEGDDELVSDACPERETEARRKLELARRALDALDQDKREVFVLAEVEQMSAPEIAAITGIPLNTVYSRLRAAKLLFERAAQRLENAPRRSR